MKMRSLERNMKAISPVLAVLMMIAVAIAGSLVTYAWVMGYIGFTTEKSGQAVMIQSIAYNNDTKTLFVYVQNVGEGVIELNDDCLYVNDALVALSSKNPSSGIVAEKATATLQTIYTVSGGQKVTTKVTTTLGTFTEKSDYPASTTVIPDEEEEAEPIFVERVQDSTTGFGGSTTLGNLLVVIAGHRSNNPFDYHTPTIPDWDLQEVAWDMTDGEDYDRRIVAIFTKEAAGSEDTVSITWGDDSGSSFTLYQEFNATSFSNVGSGANSDGIAPTGSGSEVWATSPLAIQDPTLSDTTGVNILSIGAAVWRDGGSDIDTVGFSDLDDGEIGYLSGGSPGASAYNFGNAITETSVTWDGSNDDDMVSGLLVQFDCSITP